MKPCYTRLRVELYEALGGAPLEGAVVVLGSAAMQLHGIEREIADIDLFARPWAWQRLRETGRWNVVPDLDPPPMLQWDGCAIPVHCWAQSYTNFIDTDSSVETTFGRASVVNGWPCMDLAQLREWKLEANRPKDRRDVALIQRYLQTGVRG